MAFKESKKARWLLSLLVIIIGFLVIAASCQEGETAQKTDGQPQAKAEPDGSPVTPTSDSGFDQPTVEDDEGIGGDTPGVLYSKQWPGLLNGENYDQLLLQTEEVIALGPDTDFYAQARLYHGLTLLAMDEQTETAKEDLMIAERLKAQLGENEELLLVGQVLVFEQLGDIETANIYRERAIKEIQNTELLQSIQRQNLQIQPAKIIIND